MYFTSPLTGKLCMPIRILTLTLLAFTILTLPGAGNTAGVSSDKVKTRKNRVAPSASSGSSSLITITGSGGGTSFGDYVSSGMDDPYRYFIEVPPGLGRLQVDIFDADIGAGGTSEATAGRDRDRSGFNSSATYSLIDPSGVQRPVLFSTGDNDEPAGADGAWLTLYSATGNNVRDNFGTNAYTNNDGNNNWSTNWVETDGGGGGATGGAIQVTGGQLRLQDNVAGIPNIYREADLLGSPGLNLTTANLNFDFSTSNNLESGDQISVEVSSNGGGSWTTLETFSDDGLGSRQYNITSFIANNTRVRFNLVGGFGSGEFFFVDNLRIGDDIAPAAGHWELRVDMSSATTSGDDINALGIRAHDGTSAAGGTELNIYVDSADAYGVNPPSSGSASRSYSIYPYITSGCACGKNDFDYDSNSGNTGSMTFTSRTGSFTQNYTSSSLSGDDVWRRDTLTGWTSDSSASDYGVWSAGITVNSYLSGGQNGNYINFYMSNFQAAANPPTANPAANTFRLYLRSDANAAPVKPYVSHNLGLISGPNPPVVGQASRVRVAVVVVNPTGQAITFSTPTNVVTANVPGSGAIYAGSSQVTQGTVTSQPAVGGTGNVVWNPGTVAAGATARLAYNVDITPTAAGQRVRATATPASGNGTRARYVDETGNVTQARASYLFGPLCELAVTQGIPTAIDQVDFAAAVYDGGVFLKWQTGQEVDNLGFNIYREQAGKRVLVNSELVAGSALTVGPQTPLRTGQAYAWWDGQADTKQDCIYWLEDIDLNGARAMHGPFKPAILGGKPPSSSQADILSKLGRREPQVTAVSHLDTKPKAPARPQRDVQERLASSPSIKLLTREAGWHHVTQPELAAAGLDLKADPRMLQFFFQGQEQAIVITGEQDGSFDTADSIEFYATAKDSPFTEQSVYWLSVGGQPGRRIKLENIEGKPSGSASFAYTVERKERGIYFSSLINGEKENFFGSVVSAAGVDQALALSNVYPNAEEKAELEIALQGVTDLPGSVPDHQVRVSLNGVELGRVVFDGRRNHVEKISLPHGLLRDGGNTFNLTSEAGPSDVSLVDYIRLTYRHAYRADQDSLTVNTTSEGAAALTIDGFSSPAVRVVDVTDKADPVELKGLTVAQGDTYSVTAGMLGGQTRTLLAFTSEKIKRPAALLANRPSSLGQPNNGADLLIISRREYEQSLEPLAALRRGQGLSVALVDVDDIYDEFSFGDRSPGAIKEFLAYASASWKKKPRYVLLAGDASLDPKNYLGFGDQDLVPTKLIDTAYLETASDDWFVDFDNDGLAEIAVGRLPFGSAGESSTMVAKILAYERAYPSQEVLLVADTNDGFSFEQASATLAALMPPALRVNRINRGQADPVSAKATLIEAINRGQKIVNYTGHGNINMWRGNLLTAGDAVAFENRDRLSVFVMMTCLNGYVQDAALESLAELLMKSETGGAVAVWASSGLTNPDEQAVMNQRLFAEFFSGSGAKPLGEAARNAKAVISNGDVRRTWILFGDPSMLLK